MYQDKPEWIAHQRKRWMRPDAARWWRPDAHRWMTPEAQRALLPDSMQIKAQPQPEPVDLAALEAARQQLLRLRSELLALRAELKFRQFFRSLKGYNPNQPRVPAGNPDGGQWTSGGSSASDGLDQGLATAPDQPAREDLSRLEEITNNPAISFPIDEAWNASNPNTTSPRENGFWICRDQSTGELFTRPFANPGSGASIVPGPTPNDAIAFFHTHPNRPEFGYIAGPSGADIRFATLVGLPGILRSHNGMYYFGPLLGSRALR